MNHGDDGRHVGWTCRPDSWTKVVVLRGPLPR
jgi:hypothetical protein